jgi:hypothetical protein
VLRIGDGLEARIGLPEIRQEFETGAAARRLARQDPSSREEGRVSGKPLFTPPSDFDPRFLTARHPLNQATP